MKRGEIMLEFLFTEISSWELLKSTPLPIAVYGTGNGADKVFAELERLGITPATVVASDGFVRQRTFHGYTVKSISQAEAEFGEMVVAIAFASPLPQVIADIKELSKKHRVIMPSVPVYGDEIFNKDFLARHMGEIEKAYSHLADKQSKKVFENIICFQILGDLDLLFKCETEKNEALSLLKLTDDESFLDLGAYRGDTIAEFLDKVNSYEKIVAVEPDTRTYKKLSAYCDTIENCTAVNSAIWSENTAIAFDGNKGRGASASNSGIEVPSLTVDSIFEKYGKFTYLNIDVEGAEAELLKGAKKSIKDYSPKLCMAVYHRSEDIFSLINKVCELNDTYKIYLRHHPHISFWDTNIYCIGEEND